MEDPVILLSCELSLGRVWLRIMILTFLFFFIPAQTFLIQMPGKKFPKRFDRTSYVQPQQHEIPVLRYRE